jgi:AcrR family transcriptional regulator
MASGGRKKGGDDTLILALAKGETVADAAAAAGVSERTVYRRMEEQEFQDRLQALRTMMFQRAAGKLADRTAAATDALEGMLTATNENVRLGAAKALLELAVKYSEHTEVMAKLVKLQAMFEEIKKESGRGSSV